MKNANPHAIPTQRRRSGTRKIPGVTTPMKHCPVLNPCDQDVDHWGLIQARRDATRYQEAPTLYRNFWKEAGFTLERPPLRSTARNRLRECPRRFMFQERLGLRLRGTYCPAYQTGIVFHELLEEVYSGAAPEHLATPVTKKIAQVQKDLEKAADPDTGLLPDGKPLLDVQERVAKDGALALAMATAFLHYYPVDAMLRNYEIMGIEKTYAVKVPGFTVPCVIRLDMLLRHRQTGAYWIVDHKTTSLPASERAATLPFAFQPRFYKWVTALALDAERREAELRGETVEAPPVIGGVIHHVIQKPSIRQKKTETYAEYIARVHAWYAEQGKLDPNNPPIFCSVMPHLGELLDQSLLTEVHALAVASTAHLDLGRFWPNEEACFGRYGRSPCPFIRLCRLAHDYSRWPTVLKSDYEQAFRKWQDNPETEEDSQ